jgi:predicted nucleotidyltransferase
MLDLIPQHLALLQQLLQTHVPDAEVWAYGSRVTGGAHENSDLDIVLRNPGDLSTSNDKLADLVEALQDSMMPIVVEVHDWAYLPKAFHQEIEQAYVVIQEAKALSGKEDWG